MIELRNMWIVEINLEIQPIVAIYDLDKNEVVAYRYASKKDFGGFNYDPKRHKRERYFNTEGEAVDYRNEKVAYLKEMMPKVKEFACDMSCIDNDSEFLPHKNADYGWPDNDDNKYGYYEDYTNQLNRCRLILSAWRTGMLNLNAETVRISDVKRIEWNEHRWKGEDDYTNSFKTATLHLADGRTITTHKKFEHAAVEDIFGGNFSGRIYVKEGRPLNYEDNDE